MRIHWLAAAGIFGGVLIAPLAFTPVAALAQAPRAAVAQPPTPIQLAQTPTKPAQAPVERRTALPGPAVRPGADPAGAAHAPPAAAEAYDDAAAAREAGEPMGPRYEGPADITFLTPPGAGELSRPLADEFVRYTNLKKRWVLTATKADLNGPVPLKDYHNKDERNTDPLRPGYFRLSVESRMAISPDFKMLREPEIIDQGRVRLGIYAGRLLLENRPQLLQQVIIQVAEVRYYALTFTSPSEMDDPTKDPAVIEAVKVFGAIVDSIDTIDMKAVLQDQQDRLFRTRTLFVNWTPERIRRAIVPEQWLRFIKDGKDIGYAYIVEEQADEIPIAGMKPRRTSERDLPMPGTPGEAQGVRVGTHSRSVDADGNWVESKSWQYVSFDRRHEQWRNLSISQDPEQSDPKQKENWLSEVGSSDRQLTRAFGKDKLGRAYTPPEDVAEAARGNDANLADPNNPLERMVEEYKMTILTEGRSSNAPPAERQLPPYYLPLALGEMLPRLLPLNEPKGYAFATYLTNQRSVVMRYVDVKPEASVTLGGQTRRLIPIEDRLGRTGDPTIHYMTPDGKYVGSVNPSAKLQVLPSDPQTLKTVWKDVDLSRPADVADDKPARDSMSGGR